MKSQFMKIPVNDAWQGVANCEHCKIRDSVLFADLTEQDFSRMHDDINQFEFDEGARIYTQGSKDKHVYTIRSGLVKLVQYLPDGNYRIVRLVWPSDVVGLEVLLGQSYQHDAICLQHTELCKISDQSIQDLSAENPVLMRKLMERWQKALADADTWLTRLSTGTARQRVARLILKLTKKQDMGDACLFSREDMGAMLGLTMETVSRIIAEFKREGLLIKTLSSCHQVDVVRLEKVADV
ncbi:MAG: Crp/Fnr family transcriptional regulator [bacterium]